MIYKYKCFKCNKEYEVEKPMKDATRPEYCPKCNDLMKKMYEPFSVELHAGYNADNNIRSSWQG